MAIKYKWIVSSMDCTIKETVDATELADVVNTVHWRRQAWEGGTEAEPTYFADVYGALSLNTPDPKDFVLYADLKEADVDKWLAEMTDPTPAELDANLKASINLQKNPVDETKPLPWA
tara:strand:- start:75 stop:428 length:354 start_codon:yes stop_codon:yes gene_type:complete